MSLRPTPPPKHPAEPAARSRLQDVLAAGYTKAVEANWFQRLPSELQHEIVKEATSVPPFPVTVEVDRSTKSVTMNIKYGEALKGMNIFHDVKLPSIIVTRSGPDFLEEYTKWERKTSLFYMDANIALTRVVKGQLAKWKATADPEPSVRCEQVRPVPKRAPWYVEAGHMVRIMVSFRHRVMTDDMIRCAIEAVRLCIADTFLRAFFERSLTIPLPHYPPMPFPDVEVKATNGAYRKVIINVLNSKLVIDDSMSLLFKVSLPKKSRRALLMGIREDEAANPVDGFFSLRKKSASSQSHEYAPAEVFIDRNVLVIKGITYGLPDSKVNEAFKAASLKIKSAANPITTIVWDGDPLGYVGPNGEKAPSSFVRVISMIAAAYPNLEFIFFKKEAGVALLFADKTRPYLDEQTFRSNGVRQYLGSLPFINEANTTILYPHNVLPPRAMGRNYAIAFPNNINFTTLGLMGLQYLKAKGDIDSLHFMVVGNPGYGLRQQLNSLAQAKENGTFARDYPNMDMTEIAFERK